MAITKSLPYRFSLTAFRRFEPYIVVIVDRHPIPYVWVPSHDSLAISTFSNRLRDAMNSLATHRWQTTVNMHKFDEIHRYIRVSEQIGQVIVYDKRQPSPVNDLRSDGYHTIRLKNPLPEDVEALAYLLHRRILPNTRVLIEGCSHTFLQDLALKHDIAVSLDPETGLYSMI